MQARIHFLCSTVMICLLLPKSQNKAEAEAHDLSRKSELRRQLKEAHTAKEYQTLAQYFHQQQLRYEMQAAKEEQEMAELRKNPAANPSKYPTRKDWTTHLYQYYSIKANKAKLQAIKFDKMAAESEIK